jgi:hypothetical protein
MEIINLGAFSASAQTLLLRKLTHNDSMMKVKITMASEISKYLI